MNFQNVEFLISAASKENFPTKRLPEIAFAGKSNVGKSSVINRLLQRKNFARVGDKPGKTVHVNYFTLDGTCYLVDLPGYGYARASVEVKAKWGKMIENYLHKSQMLRCVFLLIDIRHEPSENDCIMYDWIVKQGYEPIIIATKLDKIKRSQIAKQVKLIRETLKMKSETIIIPFSAETKQGRDEIYTVIDSYITEETV